MRHLAITGIETAAMISSTLLGSAIRATPPSLRMSAGTRSRAITAQAPASSAILAWSAVVTSMITPPFSISARPDFTRNVPVLSAIAPPRGTDEEPLSSRIRAPGVKSGLAEMLKGGVIMDVTTADQARIAEEAGACAVMALERVPADIRKEGGVARMADPDLIKSIMAAVTIPVMAKCRIGHFVEAQVLEALEVDYIDESEVLTPADVQHHVDKWQFTVPFVCGCTNLGEALRRIAEGAAMIRTKGEAGT